MNLSRMIKYMEVGKFYTKSDLARELGLKTTIIEECLNFILKYTNVKIELKNGKYIRYE